MKKAEMLYKKHIFAHDLTITPSNGYRASTGGSGNFTNQPINNTPAQPMNLSISMPALKNVTPTPLKTPSPTISATTTNAGYKRPRQIFTMQQEEQLAAYVRDTANYYSGLSSKEVRILAFVYGVCNQVEMPVGWRETHQASFDWCIGFIKRNKLSPMVVQSLSYKNNNNNAIKSQQLPKLMPISANNTTNGKVDKQVTNEASNGICDGNACTPIEIDD